MATIQDFEAALETVQEIATELSVRVEGVHFSRVEVDEDGNPLRSVSIWFETDDDDDVASINLLASEKAGWSEPLPMYPAGNPSR